MSLIFNVVVPELQGGSVKDADYGGGKEDQGDVVAASQRREEPTDSCGNYERCQDMPDNTPPRAA